MKKIIKLLHLYPQDMNIYGDNGNVLAIKKRLEWRGYECEIINYNPGDKFPEEVDILIGGGGQDSGQTKVAKDLQLIKEKIHNLANNNTPMLLVCGLYQLFGHRFETIDGTILPGIGIFDATTIGKSERLIGNIVTKSDIFDEIVGYENHSGQTYLGDKATPLATVIKGAGNNTSDTSEGAIYKNCIGTYLHGSVLPKNPKIADFLISKALLKNDINEPIQDLDDGISTQTRLVAFKLNR